MKASGVVIAAGAFVVVSVTSVLVLTAVSEHRAAEGYRKLSASFEEETRRLRATVQTKDAALATVREEQDRAKALAAKTGEMFKTLSRDVDGLRAENEALAKDLEETRRRALVGQSRPTDGETERLKTALAQTQADA